MIASKTYTTAPATVAMMTAVSSSCAKNNMMIWGTALAVPFFVNFIRLFALLRFFVCKTI